MKRSNHTLAVKSRQWIVEALLKLMNEMPYKDITVTFLALSAGVDRRTFYRNFTSKEDVLLYYMSDLQKNFLVDIRLLSVCDMYGLVHVYFRFWIQHKNFLRQIINNNLTNLLLYKFNDTLPAILAYFNEDTNTGKGYNEAYNVGGFWNILLRWVQRDCLESPEELANYIIEMFYRKSISLK